MGRKLSKTILQILTVATLLAPTSEAVSADRDSITEAADLARIARTSETFLAEARVRVGDGGPVLFCPRCPDPLSISADFLRELADRRILLLIPKTQSPYDVRFQIHFQDRARRYESLHIRSNRRDDHQLWLSTQYSNIRKTFDYVLSLELGEGFQSHGSGTVENNRIVNWVQNNEYRLLVLTASHDPADARFSLILQDELLINIVSAPSPDRLIPSIKPTVSIRPANLGISMAVGPRNRIKVTVGGGFVLSALPFADPQSVTQGFFRLQFRP